MASRSRDARVVLVARGRFCGVAGTPRSRGDRRAARPFCRLALARTIGWRSAAVRFENARARHVASIQRPYATVDSRFCLNARESNEGLSGAGWLLKPLRGPSAGDVILHQ